MASVKEGEAPPRLIGTSQVFGAQSFIARRARTSTFPFVNPFLGRFRLSLYWIHKTRAGYGIMEDRLMQTVFHADNAKRHAGGQYLLKIHLNAA